MRKNNFNLRILFLILLSIVISNTQAQTGLNFQGVARTTNNVILASQAITIKLSILQGSATGTAEYTETRKVTTNAQGLFTAVIGDTGAINTLGNLTTINWKNTPKFLKIEMDVAAGNNFTTMGTTQFQYVAYAQFAKSVDAENIVGIVPVSLGGTGVSTIAGLKTALVLNNVNNTTDLTKPISTLTQTALDLKLNAADTSKYTKQTYTDSALVTKQVLIGLKLNAADTIKYTKQTYSDSALLTKLSITGNAATATTATSAGTASTTTGNAGTATKLATARNINNVPFDGTANITVSADAGTLTGTALKSTITGSSLTSVGTLTSATVSGKVIVGANTSASTSAVLEVNSTNQGFLPPRVYAAQRDAIVNPVAGLTIWCINCGQYGELNVYNGVAWVNMLGFSTSSVPSISIGQNYYGGKIAYILAPNDPGYDPNTPHGLVAATEDQSTGIQWYNGSSTTTGATGTAIGTGLSNTNTIITSQGATATSYAAGLARAYAGGGYKDWYLPSKDELNKLYLNKTAIGVFAGTTYWSSTEYDANVAWYQNFNSGFQNFFNKYFTFYVRAIRAF